MNSVKGGKRFVKKIFLVLFFLLQTVFAYPPLPEANSEAEALFVRRIIEFWRDKEYTLVKSQIAAYMSTYPDGPFTDHFYALLGDMELHNKGYIEALEHYQRISDQPLKDYVQSKKWQALYHLQLYTQLYQEIAGIPPEEMGEAGAFYFAEAAFREALTLMPFDEGKEEAEALCREALPFYASLSSSTTFGAHAKLAMAEIYRFLEEPAEAAELYLEIAESNEDQDSVLFHAASMLARFDEERALKLFEKIARSESKKSPEAAFQWLQILAKREDWETIRHERDLWLSRLSDKQRALAYYYLGMIAFDKGGHYQVVADLQKALEKGIPAPHDRAALEVLMTSAKELKNLRLCDTCYALLTELYPEGRAEAGFFHAKAYHEGGESEKALILYDDLIQKHPNSEITEKAHLEKVKLLIDDKRWDEAHDEARHFVKQNPRSDQKKEMLRLAIDLSQLRVSEGELYGQLADDLEQAFKARVFNGEERVEKQALLAKAYIKLDKVHAALGLLHEMEDPDPLLFTQCYISEGNSPEKVVYFGEKALEKHPDNNRLHLHLFNAYLELAKENPDKSLTEYAASHLDSVIDNYPVSLENRLWLAHHFTKTRHERAIDLLESLFQTDANRKRFDAEGVMLARLYLLKERPEEALPVAKQLIALDQATKPEAQLILAETYLDLGKRDKAEALFAYLEDAPYPVIAQAASLQIARLRWAREPERSLKRLHNLKMCKKLAHEPIHLEAALDHAELLASLCPEDERTKSHLNTLLDVKEEFTSEKDISSKDYHASRELMPEKDQLYQAYMRYLDACIYDLQAKLASNSKERKAKETAASALFSTLRQESGSVSRYLTKHVAESTHDQ